MSETNEKEEDKTKTKNKYDLILFGVTGFTGKLAAEYLLSLSSLSLSRRQCHDSSGSSNLRQRQLQWAVCARNQAKAQQVLRDIIQSTTSTTSSTSTTISTEELLLPPVLVADLVVNDDEDGTSSSGGEEAPLREIVQQTRLVLTTAGPFAKCGRTLVKLCAELGVHYCDITGETGFVRDAIQRHDATARSTGARIVCHCGNDCVPQDLMVYELARYARQQFGPGARLLQVCTYNEVADTAELSGGTAATAIYNLGGGGGTKKEETSSSSSSSSFDPLLTTAQGVKSSYLTKNTTPKSTITTTDLGKASPWIMGPVMVNCVRRSK
jgi:short subunit dehydrogenase-like uncharacterized protein